MTVRNPIAGTAVLLEAPNIDTDQIMPKQFCLRTDRVGYEDAVFHEWRKDRGSILNDPRARASPLLVAGPSFGCGSSREHAVWGLLDFGFRAVVAPRFGDIFRANAGAAGLVTATVEDDAFAALVALLRENPGTRLALDVVAQQLAIGASAPALRVRIPAFHRHLYLGGHTETGLALHHDAGIREHERRRPAWMPTTLDGAPAGAPRST